MTKLANVKVLAQSRVFDEPSYCTGYVATPFGPIEVRADPSLPKGMLMFGGIPFSYNAGDDDDGDVDEVVKLRAKVESMQKTLDRLVKLQTINPEKTIFVLKLPAGDGWGQENHDAFLKLLPPQAMLIAMPEDYTIEGLDDRDLAEVGLRRAGQTMTERQAYDIMLMGYRK